MHSQVRYRRDVSLLYVDSVQVHTKVQMLKSKEISITSSLMFAQALFAHVMYSNITGGCLFLPICRAPKALTGPISSCLRAASGTSQWPFEVSKIVEKIASEKVRSYVT